MNHTPLQNLDSNQIYQIVLKSENSKQKTRLKNIVVSQKVAPKKMFEKAINLKNHSKFGLLSQKTNESSKNQTTMDENLTQRSNNVKENSKKSNNFKGFFELSTQNTQNTQKSLTNFQENKNLSEVLEAKIHELLQKNEKLGNEFRLTLREKTLLERENIFLVKELNILEDRNQKNEDNYKKKAEQYHKKIKDLEIELLESHDIIIDLEKKMKILTMKN